MNGRFTSQTAACSTGVVDQPELTSLGVAYVSNVATGVTKQLVHGGTLKLVLGTNGAGDDGVTCVKMIGPIGPTGLTPLVFRPVLARAVSGPGPIGDPVLLANTLNTIPCPGAST